jgi:E3 ubiquitin-protein ligase DOA10
LCEEDDMLKNPLISPCKCDGTMKFIHMDCLREWLNSKSSSKESNPPGVKTYCWKVLECELCKTRFPDRIASPEEKSKIINLLYFEKPEQDYIVLESVT